MFTQFLDKILVENWRQAWKFYSMWFYGLLGALPLLLALAVEHKIISAESGDVPELVATLIRWVAFAGGVSRIVKQFKPAWPVKEEAAEG